MKAEDTVSRLGNMERDLNRMSRRLILDSYPLHKRPEPVLKRVKREYRPPVRRRPC